jgi:N-acetylglucosaminyldiphosphoundecaprenol N-acetyl-beta-D-mannosaminyltransferase
MISSYQNISILGSRVNILSIKEVVALIDRWIGDNDTKCKQIVVTGFHGIWEAHKNPELKTILNSTDLWVPDGIAPVWVARCKGFSDAQRTPGAEIMKAFFELANEQGFSSFFYGDTEKTLADLKDKVEQNYPGHKIVGTFSPPFRQLTQKEDEQVINMINDARPDILWVALGMPKQDRWIFEHKEKLKVPLAIGVGAAYRFLSGHVKRAPKWVGDSGIEWVWRLLCQPKKLWRRELLDVPQFVTLAFLELIGVRKFD